MADSYWKIGTGWPRRGQVRWPSLVQILRQIGLTVLIAVLWGGVFIAFLRFTGAGGQVDEVFSVAEPDSVAVEAVPTDTPTLSPTKIPTPTPSATPTNTPLTTSETIQEDTTESSSDEPISIEPSPTPTETLIPEPTPTETPLSPTNTLAPVDETAEVSFSQDVFPLIERRCIKCHGGPKEDGTLRIEEGLDMRTYSSLLEGSWNGSVIEPGNVEESFLVKQIVEGEMPKKEPRLLPREIRLISTWIEAGAPDN